MRWYATLRTPLTRHALLDLGDRMRLRDHRVLTRDLVLGAEAETLRGSESADHLVRTVAVVGVDGDVERGPGGLDRIEVCLLNSSLRSVSWKRSILPIVVGERGLVRVWRMPLWRQRRSNIDWQKLLTGSAEQMRNRASIFPRNCS
jgi:hypothetical protein